MQFVEGILIALEALWANKLRTVLTLLSNIVGVMSVIALVSIIDGMNAYIRTEVAQEGSGVFRVQQVNELDILSDFDKFLKSLHNPKITLSDLGYLREHITLAEYMDANQTGGAEVRYLRRYIKSVNIQGRSENYPMLGKWKLKDGRHFSISDVQHSREVAVIGYDVSDRMYPGVDPLGKDIKIAGVNHRIIGVLDKKAGVLGGNTNLTVIMQITSFQKIFSAHRSVTISIKAANLEQVNECAEQTRGAMRSLRRLAPRREDNFAIVTSENLLK